MPQALGHTGVSRDVVTVTDVAMNILIKSYCRESGVRSLQRHIEKVGGYVERGGGNVLDVVLSSTTGGGRIQLNSVTEW